jgi:hypothetical protein
MTIMQARADRIKRYPFNEISGFSKMFFQRCFGESTEEMTSGDSDNEG